MTGILPANTIMNQLILEEEDVLFMCSQKKRETHYNKKYPKESSVSLSKDRKYPEGP